jgi:hypothetical protein
MLQPVVHEYYDEIVFTDPSPDFFRLLEALGSTHAPRHSLQVSFGLPAICQALRWPPFEWVIMESP